VSEFESEKSSDNAPVVIMQRAPFRGEEVRNHESEALSLWLQSHILAWAGPIDFVLIVLVKCRFIMGDEDKARVVNCPRHKEVRGGHVLIPFIVPGVEMTLILCKSFHKPPPIFHHILPFMAICVVVCSEVSYSSCHGSAGTPLDVGELRED
jgi:hypothetical protein